MTDSKDASDYWTTLKRRISKDEGSQLPTNCRKQKMKSLKDGKNYLTDVLDTKGILKSVPSPKAEVFYIK